MSNPGASPSRWELKGDKSLAPTRILDLRARAYRHPKRGTERDFVVVQCPDWVNVIALTPDHRIVLVRQFRFGIDNFSLEIPGGVIDQGEDPVAAGVRELEEETGHVGRNARLLGSVHPNPAFMANQCHLVFVEAAAATAALDWDADEEIEVLTAPVEEVFEWARSGKITHSLVLNALWLFEPVWEEIRRGSLNHGGTKIQRTGEV